jgi:flagellar basal body-associated protein FliL
MKSIYKFHKVVSEAVFLIISSYFVIKKIYEYSFTETLNEVFNADASKVIIKIFIFIIIYSILTRIIVYIYDQFKEKEYPNLALPHYRCLLKNNKEIANHINNMRENIFSLTEIDKHHMYEDNIQFIHKNLYDHLSESLKDKKILINDIFISYFHDETFNLDFTKIKYYSYSSHFDPTIFETHTSKIDIQQQKFKYFAGARAIKKKTTVVCAKIGTENYDKSNKDRRESIKHYFGIPLSIDQKVVGLLNIEIHNKNIFGSENEMKTFYQKEIQSFIYLYEYQLHKKYFFNNLRGIPQ